MNIKASLALLLLLCVISPAPAQTPPQTQKPASDDKDEVAKITTNLVQVDAVVTKDGKPVTNLKPEDFEIFEDGRRQEITSFAFISNLASRERPSAPEKTESVVPGCVPPGPVKPDVPRRTIA